MIPRYPNTSLSSPLRRFTSRHFFPKKGEKTGQSCCHSWFPEVKNRAVFDRRPSPARPRRCTHSTVRPGAGEETRCSPGTVGQGSREGGVHHPWYPTRYTTWSSLHRDHTDTTVTACSRCTQGRVTRVTPGAGGDDRAELPGLHQEQDCR